MTDIHEFGIHEGISEVIFTTISPDGVPNAAPIGVYYKEGRFYARIFNSKTLDNIIAKQLTAVNFTDDPVIFVQSALSNVESWKFEFIDGFPVLKDVLGWIVFDCRCKRSENISVVELLPIKAKIFQRKIKPVNRGFNAVIEATIHATRYVVLNKQKYLECVDYYNSIVQKCGGPDEKDAMKLLYGLIRS